MGDASSVIRRDGLTEESMRRYVHSIVERAEQAERRDTFMTMSETLAQWNTGTATACTVALEALNGVASNPSGLAACYNIPYLDNSTGVFKADLRLYTISAPTGTFANIPAQNVKVSLSYDGASVSAVNASTLLSRSLSLENYEGNSKRTAAPAIAQTYAFAGQISSSVLSTNPSK